MAMRPRMAVRPVGHQVFGQDAPVYYEHEFLERFYPLQPAASGARTAAPRS